MNEIRGKKKGGNYVCRRPITVKDTYIIRNQIILQRKQIIIELSKASRALLPQHVVVLHHGIQSQQNIHYLFHITKVLGGEDLKHTIHLVER